MAQKVKVFNFNTYPLEEIFKGDEVRIEANDYWRDKKGNIKVMDIFEANDFRGQYHPVPFDGSGKMLDDAKYFKKIKLEPISEVEPEDTEEEVSAFKCMAPGCKHVSPSAEELEAHVNVRHPSVEKLVLPEVDREIKKAKAKKTA